MTVDAFNALRVPYSIAFNVIRFCQLPRALRTLCLLTLPLIASNVPFVSQRSLPPVLPSDLMFVTTTFEYHPSQTAWCSASSDLLILKCFWCVIPSSDLQCFGSLVLLMLPETHVLILLRPSSDVLPDHVLMLHAEPFETKLLSAELCVLFIYFLKRKLHWI